MVVYLRQQKKSTGGKPTDRILLVTSRVKRSGLIPQPVSISPVVPGCKSRRTATNLPVTFMTTVLKTVGTILSTSLRWLATTVKCSSGVTLLTSDALKENWTI